MILLFIFPNNTTEQGITEVKGPPKTYEGSLFFKSLKNPLLPNEKMPEIINFEVRAVKVIPPTPTPTPIMYDGDILDYILLKWGDKYNEAVLIMDCESKGNIFAYNPEWVAKRRWAETGGKSGSPYSSCGLFQINSELCQKEDSVLFDPKINIDMAWELYEVRGWQPWLNCKNLNDL